MSDDQEEEDIDKYDLVFSKCISEMEEAKILLYIVVVQFYCSLFFFPFFLSS